MKVLVTGGAGFIGSFLVDELVRNKHQVLIYDNLDKQVHITSKKPVYLNKKAEFIAEDVRDYKKFKSVILNKNIEIVFHFAAKVGVGQSQYQIKEYMDVNAGGTTNLLDIIVNNKNNVKKIIVAASMSSYGEGNYYCPKCNKKIKPQLRTEKQMNEKKWEIICPVCKSILKPIPTDEQTQRDCNSIYALSKMIQEETCLIIGKTYKIPTVALRFFNVYGPRQSLSNPYTGVAAIFMSRIKNNNSPIIFEDGGQTRDFIYVTDIVNACLLAMNKKEADYDMFNVGSGRPLTIVKIAKIISDIYKVGIKPEITNKFRKGDIRHCFADITKIKNKLRFKPKIDFLSGMKKLVQWAKTEQALDMYEKAHQELLTKGLV